MLRVAAMCWATATASARRLTITDSGRQRVVICLACCAHDWHMRCARTGATSMIRVMPQMGQRTSRRIDIYAFPSVNTNDVMVTAWPVAILVLFSSMSPPPLVAVIDPWITQVTPSLL